MPAPELRLPRAAEGVRRTGPPPGRYPGERGVHAAFTDPCAGAETPDEWLACQQSLDPFVLY
jgi:hypothetical protein